MQPLPGQLAFVGIIGPDNGAVGHPGALRGAGGPSYRGYAGETPDTARALFRGRYGRDPETIRAAGAILLAGPIPQTEGQP